MNACTQPYHLEGLLDSKASTSLCLAHTLLISPYACHFASTVLSALDRLRSAETRMTLSDPITTRVIAMDAGTIPLLSDLELSSRFWHHLLLTVTRVNSESLEVPRTKRDEDHCYEYKTLVLCTTLTSV